MNELTVQVQQTPGVIKWNFEDLKAELAVQMEQYKTIVYTDETIGDAKKDVAALRKLDKAVDARRIEIKKKCLEPYDVIEEQARELKALIGEPIRLISEKVDDYEDRRKAAKKEKIMKDMDAAFADIPDEYRNKLRCKVFDTRWLNVSTAEKTWKEEIQKAHDDLLDALRILKDVDEDFLDQVMMVFVENLDLTRAMVKAQELAKQKEILIEKERQRQEQERIRREQEKIREERQRLLKEQEAARAAAEAQKTAVSASNGEAGENKEKEAANSPAGCTEATQAVEQINNAKQSMGKSAQRYRCMVLLRGTEEQLRRVMAFARYEGVECEVQRDPDRR